MPMAASGSGFLCFVNVVLLTPKLKEWVGAGVPLFTSFYFQFNWSCVAEKSQGSYSLQSMLPIPLQIYKVMIQIGMVCDWVIKFPLGVQAALFSAHYVFKGTPCFQTNKV